MKKGLTSPALMSSLKVRNLHVYKTFLYQSKGEKDQIILFFCDYSCNPLREYNVSKKKKKKKQAVLKCKQPMEYHRTRVCTVRTHKVWMYVKMKSVCKDQTSSSTGLLSMCI